jgi:hypothetical protein
MHLKRAQSVVVAVLATPDTAVILPSAPAQAATSDVDYRDVSNRDTNNIQVPTDEKPPSKLWFQDGTRWGVLYSTPAHATTIQRLSLATHLALNSWAHFNIHAVVASSGASTVQVTMDGVSTYRTTPASRGTAGIRTLQVGNDKQLPFALLVDNIEARI